MTSFTFIREGKTLHIPPRFDREIKILPKEWLKLSAVLFVKLGQADRSDRPHPTREEEE